MKILIAGGAGYIGSVLIPKLLERGYEVDVIDLFWFGNQLPKEVGIIKKDIFHLDENDVKGYDQVIFLAGLSNDPMAEYSPAENFVSNGSAPPFLAYISKKAGVRRFIYAGSCSVYGYTVNELYDETSPAVSSYPYGISKLQGETAVLQMQDKNFSVIAFRQGTVSGYSPRMRLDLVVNTMFKFALTEGTITVNNPAIWRPILSIQDAATAYIRAIESNGDISGIFNIASGNYTVGEIGDLVRSGVKKYLQKDVKLNIKHIQDYRNYKVSIEKAKKVLSFHPKNDVETIIEDLVENREKFEDFDNPNYYNIQVFKKISKK
jgi:nucleoside-diphosphate-sugar epimerase